FYGDANEAESWMKEKRPLVESSDCGRDAHAAGALLARHRALHDQIRAHDADPALEEEEFVNESRLVPTDVWEEEPVERLEHRTVTEERSVPQVRPSTVHRDRRLCVVRPQ
ncbi:Uncharacterized protein OBRU01_09527, partial [Operophtera brumata]